MYKCNDVKIIFEELVYFKKQMYLIKKQQIMKKILLLLLVLSVFACSGDDDAKIEPLTYNYFKTNLKPKMNYTSIVNIFGEPTKDIGSGIHIYVYQLPDSTEIWIGYVNEILYARHVDKNEQVLHTII